MLSRTLCYCCAWSTYDGWVQCEAGIWMDRLWHTDSSAIDSRTMQLCFLTNTL
jgi:hypothetical protein